MRIGSRQFALGLLLSAACSPSDAPGVQVRMRFTAGSGFYEAPFPSEHRRTAAGGVDLSGFPNPTGVDLARQLVRVLERDADGFGTSSAIFFPMSGAISIAALPASPTASDPNLILLGVDPSAPDFGVRYPLTARVSAGAGLFGAENLLTLLPMQGVPLRPHTLYAAAVGRSLGDAEGHPLGVSEAMTALAGGDAPEGLEGEAKERYLAAVAALDRAGIDPETLAGVTVFRTQDPTAGLASITAAALARPLPAPRLPLEAAEIFDDTCVFHTTIDLPDFQAGDPPFTSEGGAFAYDAEGRPILAREATSNFVLTIPRRAMPAAGYPITVFIRTGGGGDRPLVDRGVHTDPGGPAIEPGSGLARTFAQAGFAGLSVDGPHGGLRNITHGDEQFLIFNIQNPDALRDNLRQSALELALLAHVIERLAVDVSSCPGAITPGGGPARFDVAHLALMGHSMGGTIAPLVLAIEPLYKAVLLSGAGGSWIENVMHKRKPLLVKGFAEILIGYADLGLELTAHDPLVSLLQWAGEAADPPIYARANIAEPHARAPAHVLMMQGIVDNYITPPIANALSLSLGLDLAGEPLEPTFGALAPLVGRSVVELPVSGNRSAAGASVTAVVLQHQEDGIEDGHEVVFQTEAPKHAIRCFLESWAQGGTPRVPVRGDEASPCE